MKHKLIVAFLALATVSWAQTTTQTTVPDTQQNNTPAEKAKCPCCDKAPADAKASAEAKDTHSCCAQHAKHMADAKNQPSFCPDKDAKSCMRAGKSDAACYGDSCGREKRVAKCSTDKCAKERKTGCCSKKDEKTARNCCGKELRS